MLRSSVMFALAVTIAVLVAGSAASNPPAASTVGTSPPVVCDKDKCTCVGSFQVCQAAFSKEKKCSEEIGCVNPPLGTPDALANRLYCTCKTKSAKAKK